MPDLVHIPVEEVDEWTVTFRDEYEWIVDGKETV
jgi:hypothetical protein